MYNDVISRLLQITYQSTKRKRSMGSGNELGVHRLFSYDINENSNIQITNQNLAYVHEKIKTGLKNKKGLRLRFDTVYEQEDEITLCSMYAVLQILWSNEDLRNKLDQWTQDMLNIMHGNGTRFPGKFQGKPEIMENYHWSRKHEKDTELYQTPEHFADFAYAMFKHGYKNHETLNVIRMGMYDNDEPEKKLEPLAIPDCTTIYYWKLGKYDRALKAKYYRDSDGKTLEYDCRRLDNKNKITEKNYTVAQVEEIINTLQQKVDKSKTHEIYGFGIQVTFAKYEGEPSHFISSVNGTRWYDADAPKRTRLQEYPERFGEDGVYFDELVLIMGPKIIKYKS